MTSDSIEYRRIDCARDDHAVMDPTDRRALAVDILRCEVLAATLRGDATPCRLVVSWQGALPGPRYLPEPWTGHLGIAPILFVSSNPSSGERDEPVDQAGWNTSESADDELIRGTDGAFDDEQRPGIVSGVYLVDRFGKHAGRPVPFWRWNRRIAGELIGREPVPGRDYALTEVVHCGSRGEFGVVEAAPTCASRYLKRLLTASPARVVIVTGDKALGAFENETGVKLQDRCWGPDELLGATRYVIALPHPNRRGSLWGLDPHLGLARANAVRNFIREAVP
jgi:hypothetical protein